MSLHHIARTIVNKVAMCVARDHRRTAVRIVREALEKTQKEATPQLDKLEVVLTKLREALAYYYLPAPNEIMEWHRHCDAISAAGGNPPDEAGWRVEMALRHLES